MVFLCPVLRQLLPPGDGEIICARAQGVLDEHPILVILPSVQELLYPPLDGVGCGDMLGSLQYHRLEYEEPLQVPLSVPHTRSSPLIVLTKHLPTFPLGAS